MLMRLLTAVFAAAILPSTAFSPSYATPQMRPVRSSPVRVSWAHGICRGCLIATSISDVEFVSASEAWAIGYAPPGGAGAGDYTILHTRDGGRSWVEIPATYSHNEPPSLSLATRRDGWIMVPDDGNAGQRLLATRDGGRHWRRLSPRDLFLEGIQDLGEGHGLAYSFNVYTKRGDLWLATAHARQWIKRPLPLGFDPDQADFQDQEHGVLAGCEDHRVVIMRTIDGGRAWITTPIDLPQPTGEGGECAYSVSDLSLGGDGRGWALVNKDSFNSGDTTGFVEALRTTDGGASWTPAIRRTLAEPAPGGPAPLFASGWFDLTPHFTAIGDLDGEASVLLESEPQLSYSTDGAKTWTSQTVAHSFAKCRAFVGSLTCGSNDRGFWVARISAAPRPVSQPP